MRGRGLHDAGGRGGGPEQYERSGIEDDSTGYAAAGRGQSRDVVVLGRGGQYAFAGVECGEAGGDAVVMARRRGGGAGFFALLLGMSAWGCGYHVAGTSTALPKSVHVIAVEALENKTTSY